MKISEPDKNLIDGSKFRIAIIVSNNVIGIVIKIVELAFSDRRNKIATIMAKNNPNHMLSLTLFIASPTKSAWL